jgi:hypothetical protein
MPKNRSYRKTVENGLKSLADAFVEEEEKDKKTLAMQKGRQRDSGILFSIRNKRLGIMIGAEDEMIVKIIYKKTTTGEVNPYEVEPYSYRNRRLKVGLRKMLYAYDVKDKRIKSFALRNIRNVEVTNKPYQRVRWPIEIRFT